MTTRLNPPDWASYDPNMLVNVSDMQYYYENFTDVVDKQATENKNSIGTLDGRVTALEQSIPVGPGGDGAFLHLGGTPGRYPSQEEMVAGDTPEETSYMVIARPGGIYFYNPKTKHLISPKSGGGTIAVHAQFPQVFDAGHSLTHNGRAGMSGVYTAKSSDIGLGAEFTTFDNCKLLVVVNDDGEEYQTAFSPDGTASRIFRKGSQNAVWGFATGGGGGGGTTDPIVIQEIKDRLDALEAYDHLENITDLKDVVLDEVTDVNGLLYMDATGKIRGGSTNPMLSMGAAHVHTNAVGAPPVVSGANVSATVVASNNVIIFKGTLTKQVNLPNVVAYNTYKPTTSQVREGRTTFIVNTSDVTLTVRAPTGGMFYIEGNMDSTNAVIPAKTVFVYNPAIIDNGSGAMIECWIYMGNYPLRATDLSTITLEVAAIRTLVEDHLDEFDKMSTGQISTSWNGLSCRPMATSNDVSATSIASTPFVIGQSGNTGKKYTLPDIASHDATSLSSTQVREGRITLLVNLATVTRSVVLSDGCKFNMGGSNITTTQTIPAKAVWMFSPGIYNNGDKVWTFLGSFSAETLDFKTLESRVTTLEARPTGSATFTGLTDTPASYTGNANKIPVVRANETGMDFVDAITPLGARLGVVEDAISDHLDDFTAMQDGHIPTSWNGLGARPVSSLNDITTLNIADSPFCIGTGSVAGKKFILPNIADMAATHLGDEDVREGRTTYLINLGTVSRNVELTNGCKINVTGGTTSASQTIPRKTVWILSPGIHAGEKVWTFIGTLSAQALDIEALVDRIAALESRPVIEKFTDLDDTPADYRPGQVLRYNQAGDAVTSTEFGFKHMTDTPNDYTGHKGKMLVVNNGETAVEFQSVPDTSGLQTQIDNNHNDIIALQNMDTVIGNRVTALENAGPGGASEFTGLSDTPADYTGHGGKAVVVNSGATALEFASVPTAAAVDANTAWRTKVESGDSSGKVNSNCMYGAMQIKDGALSATELATCTAGYVTGSTARTCTLPKVVDLSATDLGADEARFGKQIRMTNMSTQTMTINVQGGGRIYKPDGSYATSVTLAATKFADFHAVWMPGYNRFAWIMMVP